MEPTIAILHPGQGAYSPGLLRRVDASHPDAASVLSRIRDAWLAETGEDLDELRRDDTTDITALAARSIGLSQIAIFAAAVGMHEALAGEIPENRVHAGHSLGEIAALTCGGAWTVEDGARVIAARVRALAHVQQDGAMTAVSGERARTASLVQAVGHDQLVVAGHNGPGQTVVSGPITALERFEAAAGAVGVSTTRLSSPYAFHSPVMREAAELFEQEIRAIGCTAPRAPVYSPILGRYYRQDEDLPRLVASHLIEPFDFGSAVRLLQDEGVSTFIECGGRSALTSAVRRSLGSAGGPRRTDATVAGSDWRAVPGDTDPLLGEARHALRGGLDATPAPQGPDQTDVAALAGRVLAMVREDVARLVHDELSRVGAVAPTAVPDGVIELPVGGANGARGGAAAVETLSSVEPASAAEPAPARGPVDRLDVLTELVSMYATALEYPSEVLEEDVQLEGDLGVDSVKQTELLARAADRFGLPPQPEGFAVGKFPTLGHIADLIVETAA